MLLMQPQRPRPEFPMRTISAYFFQFLLDQNPMFKDKTMKDFTVDVLDQIKAVDLEEYEEYLKVYKSADSSKTETNGERGVKRKNFCAAEFLCLLL